MTNVNPHPAKSSENLKKIILVVEDEEDIRKAVIFRIRQAGFETLSAEDGEMAVRIAQGMRPSLILLDLKLPKLSGEEVCKAIKDGDDLDLRKTPIIMLTAKTSDVDQVIGHVIGANCYMTKPFDMDELINNITKYVRN